MRKMGMVAGVLLVMVSAVGLEGFFYLGRPVFAALCGVGLLLSLILLVELEARSGRDGE